MANVQLSGVAPAIGAGAGNGAFGSAGTVVPVMPAAVAAPAVTHTDSGVNPVAGVDAGQAPALPRVAAADGSTASPKAADPELKKAVKDANAALAANGTQLVFVFDDQTHHFAVKLLDIQTQKVVQELPPAAMRAAASALSGPSTSGTLVDTKA